MSLPFISPAFVNRGAGSEDAASAIWAEGVWADCVWADGVWLGDVPGCEAGPPTAVYSGMFIRRRHMEDLIRVNL